MVKTKPLRVIPLGGLGEVGRNMMLLEYGKEILIIDAGLRFPEEDMLGIDLLIPNTKYLQDKKENIVGIAITHGHYDHLGAIPYIIDRLGNPPIFASRLSAGIILKRQQDFPNQPKLNLTQVEDGDKVKAGSFEIEFVKLNHNIPDNLALLIKTPIGNIFHTSDFKFDSDPVNDTPTDFERLEKIGKEGILLLLADSTGAEKEGHSLSERTILQNLDQIFKESKGLVVTATFASLINRIQQVIYLSEKYGRKVAIDGYTMKTNVEISMRLGYIKAKKGTFISPKQIPDYPRSKVTLLCTGAQGEERAVLMRIANKEYPFVRLQEGDTIIFSSSVIPGNERTVQILKDEFYRQKAKVVHYQMMDIHAGGHSQREELLQLNKLLKPKFFIPIHGQYSMLANHAELAIEKAGMPKENVVVIENGQVVTVTPNTIKVEKETVPANYVMVDGLGIGDVGEVVLRDRQNLANDGMFVIVAAVDRKTGKVKQSPDIISRGFVYLKESKDLLFEARKRIVKIIEKSTGSAGAVNWSFVKENLRNKVGEFLYERTQRRPMVLPVIIEV